MSQPHASKHSIINNGVFQYLCLECIYIVKLKEPPENFMATPNQEVNFTCVAVAEKIDFFINGTRAVDSRVAEAGLNLFEQDLIQQDNSYGVHVVSRTLIGTAGSQNNNTLITCRAMMRLENDNFLVKISDPAILHVYG